MISINKQGNAIVIEFTDNDKYLFNGKIEVAPNELIVVTDDSEMATFKKASNGDVLFSQLISDIQIAGSPVTKDTIIDQFATIGFISGSGEGAVSSVNGQTGEVVITPDSLNVYNKTEIDTALNGKQGKLSAGYPLTLDEQNNLSLAPEGYATKEELATKQDSLISGHNIKTINGQDVLGQGDIEISGGGTVDSELSETSENPVQNKVITAALNGKQAAGDYATKTELATKQDSLVSGTNIKTINGNSILGEGNIEITGGTVDTTMSDTSENAVQNKVIKTYVDGLVGDINSVLTRING